jgi:hypothetical protein
LLINTKLHHSLFVSVLKLAALVVSDGENIDGSTLHYVERHDDDIELSPEEGRDIRA